MPNDTDSPEYGLPRSGHDTTGGAPVLLGEGKYRYEVSGENWGRLSDGWYYREATAISVGQRERVYVFNRGTSPVLVFDTAGNMLDSWGQGIFKNPHGIAVDSHGDIYVAKVAHSDFGRPWNFSEELRSMQKMVKVL
ncbi:MAG TPA: hypothetical protein EYM69_03335 [Dehalococcoidia bacterium]|nr:hypothetical protein [Dehalococcoidia bacterium]